MTAPAIERSTDFVIPSWLDSVLIALRRLCELCATPRHPPDSMSRRAAAANGAKSGATQPPASANAGAAPLPITREEVLHLTGRLLAALRAPPAERHAAWIALKKETVSP